MEETETLAQVIENDPRIGTVIVVVATGLVGIIKHVFRFADGFEQFSVVVDGVGELLNSDEVEVE